LTVEVQQNGSLGNKQYTGTDLAAFGDVTYLQFLDWGWGSHVDVGHKSICSEIVIEIHHDNNLEIVVHAY
jgi:hypothetical protein